jgi:hypothetical protein
MLATIEGGFRRLKRIDGKPKRPCEIVGRAEGKHGHRLVQLKQCRECLGERSVAASDDDAVHTRAMSRGSGPSDCSSKPLVSFQINRQLSGWNLPPQVIRAFEAHHKV